MKIKNKKIKKNNKKKINNKMAMMIKIIKWKQKIKVNNKLLNNGYKQPLLIGYYKINKSLKYY